MRRKDGYRSNLIGEQGRDPVGTLFLVERQTRRKGEDFPGHFLPARISPSKNSGSPWLQGIKRQGPQEHPEKSDHKNGNPEKIVETTNKIGGSGNPYCAEMTPRFSKPFWNNL